MFLDDSSCPYYYQYHFRFHIAHVFNFYYEDFIFQNLLSASFLITFLSPRIATSINMLVPCLLSRIMTSGFFVRNSSVGSHLFDPLYNITVPSLIISTDFSTVHFHTSVCCIILLVFPCMC
jgi:hypothetical protein